MGVVLWLVDSEPCRFKSVKFGVGYKKGLSSILMLFLLLNPQCMPRLEKQKVSNIEHIGRKTKRYSMITGNWSGQFCESEGIGNIRF